MEEMNFAELLEMGEYGTEFGAEFASMGGMDPMTSMLLASFAWAGIVFFAIIALMVVARCFVFKKMWNQWYEALISWHNLYVLITKSGKPWRWVFAPLLMIIPIIGWIIGGILSLIVWILVSLWLAKKFGKGNGFAIGLIFLPFIFYPILAWGNAKYKK
jgi:hypothetical protein